MKKLIKLTSGVLASTVFLTNFSTLEIATAKDLPLVKVENENADVKTKVLERDGKYYLTVEAVKDVENISIKVKVGEMSKVFKHARPLALGKSVEFEIELPKSVTKAKGKILPNTEVFRETVELNANINGHKLSVSVSYDLDREVVEPLTPTVEEQDQDVPVPVEKTEEAKPETKETLDPEVKEEVVAVPTEESSEPEVARTVKPAEATHASEVVIQPTPQPATPVVNAIVFSSVPQPATSEVVEGNFDQAAADEIFKLVNEYRVANGLNALARDNDIASGTEVRADEFAKLVKRGYKDPMELHKRLDGREWKTAFDGLKMGDVEILAYSRNGASSLVNWWKKSPVHNAVMLRAGFKSVSIKVLVKDGQYYGVQIFR
ncbi:hypothetical protein KMP11_07520 [Gemella sp. zg-570]|uniref:CAP domain-containing protein n=1 Tax=Gemella sp. zg-570 TaxID=2840371 RepID=UPI001C0C8DE3|nr:CAP domain-containing protein [Gemella sp. zg-570]QWQ38777.1 hypothetical protein KMP11_07520 [Gemella sp. zg-570]